MNKYIKRQLRKDNGWKHQLDLLFKVEQSKGIKRIWNQIRLNVWEWWYKRPFQCKFGFHKFSWESFGWDSKYMGQIHFDCFRCRTTLLYIPIDDLPPDEQRKKLQFVSDIKKMKRKEKDDK